jgi:hypothetical protein
MDEVIHDLLAKDITAKERTVNAFRCFLIAKTSGAARFIMDLSPWTPYYKTPPMWLYSAAEVLVTIPPHYQMIKIDLTSGLFQIRIAPEYTRHYGIYYRGQHYTLQRLPMGHPLAPSKLQRFSAHVSAVLHNQHGVSMVAYLDDWLLFAQDLPIQQILHTLRQLGFTINYDKSHLQLKTCQSNRYCTHYGSWDLPSTMIS